MVTIAAQMPVRALARIVGEHDTRLWRVVKHYVDEARLWLWNPERLTPEQRDRLDGLLDPSRIALDTAEAYRLNLAFQEFRDLPPELARLHVEPWCLHAEGSGPAPMARVARTIRKQSAGILRWLHSRITNGMLEAMTSVVQAVKVRARSYTTTENFITMAYLVCGKLVLPGQNCTHVGTQYGTVRGRGREPSGRRFADRGVLEPERGSGYSVVSTQRGRRGVREREEGSGAALSGRGGTQGGGRPPRRDRQADVVQLDCGRAARESPGRPEERIRSAAAPGVEAGSLQGDHPDSAGRVPRSQRRASVPVGAGGGLRRRVRPGEAARSGGPPAGARGAARAVQDAARASGRGGLRGVPAATWGRRYALIVVPGYSRRMWLRFYERQTMGVVIHGLEESFVCFGGVPAEILFDQMKAVVIADGRSSGESEHRTHLLKADRGHQPMEPGTRDPPRSGTVPDLRPRPPPGTSPGCGPDPPVRTAVVGSPGSRGPG